MLNNKTLVIVMLGIIIGMVLFVPTIFLSDVVAGGAVGGAVAWVIGYISGKRNKTDQPTQ